MMKRICAGTMLALTLGAGAHAGGLDRSGQSIALIFEDGNFAEFSFGYVMPSVSGIGVNNAGDGVGATGDMAGDYFRLGFGLRQQVNDNLGIALIYDQPYGANVDYSETADYALAGTSAIVDSMALSFVVQYQLTERFSLIGGLRYQTISGDVALVADPLAVDYAMEAQGSGELGYIVGVAYEIPEIALRAALTYHSAITHTMTAQEGNSLGTVDSADFDVTMPQAVSLDFQTGIAANTLLTASVRWVEWSVFDVTPVGYAAGNVGASLVDLEDDVLTYSLGIGRRFSDRFSGSLSVSYEAAVGGSSSDLTPTDGSIGVTIGGRYTLANGVILSAGVNYTWLGDTTTDLGATFAGNSAIGVGFKLGYAF